LTPTLVWILALSATPAQKQEARDLSRRSIVEYNGGEFEKALADIQRAYDLDPRPGMLFNLAQCHRGLEHWKKAKFFYESYLREVPGAPNRKNVLNILEEVDKKVEELDEKDAALQAAQKPPERIQTTVPIILAAPPGPAPLVLSPFAEPEPASASHKGRTTGWALGGIGLGAGVAGTVLGVVAQGVFGKKTTTPPAGYPPGTYYIGVTTNQFHTASTEAYAADVLWGVGGALVVTGVILLLTSH
jgi:tetratricopeptide (TPR) repeat protein